jgi:hypothetical protein
MCGVGGHATQTTTGFRHGSSPRPAPDLELTTGQTRCDFPEWFRASLKVYITAY